MSGLNKGKTTKKYLWRRTFFVLTLIYLIVVLALGIGAYRLPAIYGKIDQARISEIKESIKDALARDDETGRKAQLADLVAENNIDLIVLSNQGFSYRTTETGDVNVVKGQINERSLSFESSYSLTIEQADYQIFLAVYQMEPQRFFEIVILLLIVGVLILFILLSSLIFMMFKKLIDPIKRLRNHILKLKKYQFGEVEHEFSASEYDTLSEELSEFTNDLQGKMENIGISYTALEQALQIEKEKLIYKDQLIGTMVHNLKVPTSIALFYLEKLIKEIDNPEQVAQLKEVLTQNELLFSEMKEIVQVAHDSELKRQKEKADIVQTARATFNRFESVLQEKDIIYYMDSPESLFVWMDIIELKQLLYNIVSNAIQYTPNGNSISLTIFEENQQLHLEVYNGVSDISELDFERVFNPFYSVQGKKEGHGSGIGMYTIKQTVDQNHGTCSFAPYEDGVVLKILLPLGADSNEK